MAGSLKFKRGATFRAVCTYIPPEGGGLPSLDGAQITSELRVPPAGKLVQELTVQPAVDGMSFTLYATDKETTLWPIAALAWDIRVEIDGEVIYTETIALQVIQQITLLDLTP